MKILVFSDTHLTNRFDQARFDVMAKLIAEADQVVINGDFWDGYLIQFADFINSGWQELFPILKAKQTVYINGNHDKPQYADERTNFFSNLQALEYRVKVADTEYVFTHGHLLSAAVDGGLHLSVRQLRSPLYRAITKFFSDLEGLTIKLFGRAILHFGWLHHRKMKRWIKKNLADNQCLVCGHSHTAELDHRRRFYNPGSFNHGLISCLWIDEDGVKLIRDRY